MSAESVCADGLNVLVQDALVSDLSPFLHCESFKGLAARSIIGSLHRKFLPLGDSTLQDSRALEKFLSINESAGKWSPPTGDDLYFRFIGEVENAISHIPDDFGPSEVFDRLRCGPGANRSVNSATYFDKFSGSLSASSQGLVQLYKSCVGLSSGATLVAELRRSVHHGFKIQRGNRLFFVLKNAEISRTCCTENLLDMIFQLAIGDELCDCLDKTWGIRLSSEPDHNRELARLGSIDGRTATIDLTSASDSEPLPLVTRMFHTKKRFLGMMQSCRSDVSILPDGSHVRLGMFSTMGNGFTFPLQTLTFASAVSAVYHAYGRSLPRGRKRDWGVFGDDITCPSDLFGPLCHLLETLGFSVNRSKSYNTGSFRESCGHDYHSGRNIRGVYIRTYSTVPDLYSAYNRIAYFAALHDLPLFGTLDLIRSRIPKRFLHFVPFHEDDCAGIKVPYSSAGSVRRVGAYRNLSYDKLHFVPRREKISKSLRRVQNEELLLSSAIRGDFCTPPSRLGSAPQEPEVSFGSRFGGKWRLGKGFTPYWDYAELTDKTVFQRWKTLMDLVW